MSPCVYLSQHTNVIAGKLITNSNHRMNNDSLLVGWFVRCFASFVCLQRRQVVKSTNHRLAESAYKQTERTPIEAEHKANNWLTLAESVSHHSDENQSLNQHTE